MLKTSQSQFYAHIHSRTEKLIEKHHKKPREHILDESPKYAASPQHLITKILKKERQGRTRQYEAKRLKYRRPKKIIVVEGSRKRKVYELRDEEALDAGSDFIALGDSQHSQSAPVLLGTLTPQSQQIDSLLHETDEARRGTSPPQHNPLLVLSNKFKEDDEPHITLTVDVTAVGKEKRKRMRQDVAYPTLSIRPRQKEDFLELNRSVDLSRQKISRQFVKFGDRIVDSRKQCREGQVTSAGTVRTQHGSPSWMDCAWQQIGTPGSPSFRATNTSWSMRSGFSSLRSPSMTQIVISPEDYIHESMCTTMSSSGFEGGLARGSAGSPTSPPAKQNPTHEERLFAQYCRSIGSPVSPTRKRAVEPSTPDQPTGSDVDCDELVSSFPGKKLPKLPKNLWLKHHGHHYRKREYLRRKREEEQAKELTSPTSKGAAGVMLRASPKKTSNSASSVFHLTAET